MAGLNGTQYDQARAGAALRARSYWSQSREIVLKALTLNVMILRCGKVFDRVGLTLYPCKLT